MNEPLPLYCNGLWEWDFFFFWVKLLFYRPCSPHSELWLVAASLRETQQLRKQQEPQEKNKTTTNKQTLFQLSEPDPWQSHFLASKDCLQSTLICTCGYFDDHLIYFFFLVFLFFFFLWFVNLFKIWIKLFIRYWLILFVRACVRALEIFTVSLVPAFSVSSCSHWNDDSEYHLRETQTCLAEVRPVSFLNSF